MNRLRLWGQQAARALQKALQDEKQRVNVLLCIGVAGMLLLAVSAWLPAEPEPERETDAQPGDAVSYEASLESRLTAMIEQVDGAGRTRVMVTLYNGEESVYATDTDSGADGTTSTSHVLVGGGALLETTVSPQVLGVAVICEGGGEATVQNRVSALVETLTGVGANHITVTKMAPAE